MMFVSLLVLSVLAVRAGGVAIDNGVMGYPDLMCGAEGLAIRVQTQRPFTGRIFVKGESQIPGCFHDSSLDSLRMTESKVELFVPLGMCRMRRERMGSLGGMEQELVVIVSFHPIFLTKVDQAYQIRCLYMAADKLVTQSLDVSMITTEAISVASPMPDCDYSVRLGSLDGPQAQFANIGEKLVHVWRCRMDFATRMMGMLVRNCVVESGTGKIFRALDDMGCPLDAHVIPALNYDVDPESIFAYAETHAFKFADDVSLRFQCEIRLCNVDEGGCEGVTPPECAPLPASARLPRSAALRKPSSMPLIPVVLTNEELVVMDPLPSPARGSQDQLGCGRLSSPPRPLWPAVLASTLLLLLCSLVAVFVFRSAHFTRPN